jgi:hypothetical protein
MNEKMKAIAAQVAKMTEAERAAIAERMPVVTIAGHVISARNTVLLAMQSADPVTIIGGFRQWLEAGRVVRKGEKAAYILRPIVRKGEAAQDGAGDAGGDGEDVSRFFVPVPMFDVGQTDTLEPTAAQ